jgi:ATP-dependent Clp protease adaptor protein ClpS
MTASVPFNAVAAPETETDERICTRRIPPYNVLIHNDDHHSMEFVVEVLCKALGVNLERAVEFMLTAHNSGVAVVWTGSKEGAELKAEQIATFHEVRERDGANLGPVGCSIEPAPGA